MCGAGVVGLTTAMLLANDGHEVTVLERDPAPPPAPDAAWEDWERRGVGQFRLPHFLLPAFRNLAESELPSLVDALVAGGALRINLLGPFAEALDPTGRYDVVTARRPLVEAVMAAEADSTKGVAVHRGVAIAGVVTEGDGVPRVVGLRSETGQEWRGDLVVDVAGRRSPMVSWLAAAGARPATVEEEDSGFVYYGRHVRAPEGVELGGPGGLYFGSVGLLVLPADDRISGIGIISVNDDAELRVLRHEEPWRAAMALLPNGQQILECEFVSPLVSMTSIEDRWRRFVVGGEPVATGVVSVGDAWAATNPTLGRGISLGTKQGRALRDVLREVDADPERVVRRFDEVTQDEFTPWYRSTIWHDRHRVDDLRAARAPGAPAVSAAAADPTWSDYLRFEGAFRNDPTNLLPRFLGSILLEERPDQVIADPAVLARLDELGAGVPAAAGPTRTELLAAVER